MGKNNAVLIVRENCLYNFIAGFHVIELFNFRFFDFVNVDERRKNFKKGIDGDDSRRKREENTIELRNNRREEMIQKRRMKNDGTATNEQAGNEENTNINFGDLSREEMVRVLLCAFILT